MNKNSPVFVTGHKGLVGSAVVRRLQSHGFKNILTADRKACDLLYQGETEDFFHTFRPEYVIHCAAKVGGIVFHRDHPVSALAENLKIAENVIHAAANANVKKLLFLGSACAYPKHAKVPITEDALLSGPLEPTNLGYALAKIAGIELCRAYKREQGKNFISCMPTNLYGPNDNYDLQNSHVLPGLVRRFHEARNDREIVLWGTGKPRREFLYSYDLAEACLFLMENYNGDEAINIGCGENFSIAELALKIAKLVGFGGKIRWDHEHPDGTPNRLLDVSKIFGMGWRPVINLNEGLKRAYEDFLQRL